MDGLPESKSTQHDLTKIQVTFKLGNMVFPVNNNKKNTIKYAKLPEYDFDSTAKWKKQSYVLPPRLRQMIQIDDHLLETSRSLKFYNNLPQKLGRSIIVKSGSDTDDGHNVTHRDTPYRKIATICEDDETQRHIKHRIETKNISPVGALPLTIKQKRCNRAAATDFEDRAKERRKTISRLTTSKYSKSDSHSNRAANGVLANNQKINPKTRTSNNASSMKISKDCHMPDTLGSSKSCVNKEAKAADEYAMETNLLKKKLGSNYKGKSGMTSWHTNNPTEKALLNTQKLKTPQHSAVKTGSDYQSKSKPETVPTIHVPMEKDNHLRKDEAVLQAPSTSEKNIGTDLENYTPIKNIFIRKKDNSTETQTCESKMFEVLDQNTEIEKTYFDKSDTMDKGTETNKTEFIEKYENNKFESALSVTTLATDNTVKDVEMENNNLKNRINKNDLNRELIMKDTDDLNIPNVSLLKDKRELCKQTIDLESRSLPNLQIPSLNMNPLKKNYERMVCNSGSYIIRRATVTYTSRQKINFHVIDDNGQTPHKPNHMSSLTYPMNVVSVLKNKLINKSEDEEITVTKSRKRENDVKVKKDNKFDTEIRHRSSTSSSVTGKFVKPSDTINTIRMNSDLLQGNFVCEQFQRELNFIDSFFESLQYLENSSLSNKSLFENKMENWVNNIDLNLKSPHEDYETFYTKLEHAANGEDTETMASKSLCLLNLLIRDEQRRAKNLLMVLKMREDALKDYTKSQIIWLENKKKQENTDVSTLKKKQRGALLKLQHECGEMQRMRKALLALSDKRKVAFVKTKKIIELKLKNNVNVDRSVFGKKKLKISSMERNTAPLKCFDLSSSGCDENSSSRLKSETTLLRPGTSPVGSAEKCIQTGCSLFETTQNDQATDTTGESIVAVDGGYLNILFNNLSLPKIFSNGKQYEVNEEALKNIVHSTTTRQSSMSDGETLQKFIDQMKKSDLEKSSTPSTARSLVDEFDQFYKGFTEEENQLNNVEHDLISHSDQEREVTSVQRVFDVRSTPEMSSEGSSIAFGDQRSDVVEKETDIPSVEPVRTTMSSITPEGPLPVPVGAADAAPNVVPVSFAPKAEQSANANTESSESVSSVETHATPVSSLTSVCCDEAEELRRQQLAIEKEIKALEQQQSQLLVREIPDKPPPPYTPPADGRGAGGAGAGAAGGGARGGRPARPLHPLLVDDTIENQIYIAITDFNRLAPTAEPSDAFEMFVSDFCQESIEKHKVEQSDKPWDACNLLPQKPQVDREQLAKKATVELKEILSGGPPVSVSGLAARRADHIDDILFAEWRRCEPEWTSLHADEAIVKSQIFESIFQKILSETVNEYKAIVPTKCEQDSL